MNLTAFILFIFVLQAICLYIGSKSTKDLKNREDYFLAGKGISFFPLMMTFLATQVGGGLILGSAEEAYQYGWSVLFYPLGAVLGLLVLGLGVGKKLAQLKISTLAQIFETFYRSPYLKKVASLLSIFSLFMILIAQIIASKKFMISLGVDNQLWFIAFWGVVILYTAVGGLKAVIATDVVQAGFFIGAFFICFCFAVNNSEISVKQLVDLGFAGEHFDYSSSKLFGWLLMPLLFMTVEQGMGQRCFAAESPKIVSKAALCAAGCTLLISMIPIFLGILAKVNGVAVPQGASVLMVVIQEATNPLVTALVGCAILAAIISTGDSLINAIGSNISQDFGISKEKDNIRLSQLLSVGISLAALGFSYYFNNVIDVLVQSYALSVSCLFVPIIFALFKRNGNGISAALSLFFGGSGFIVFNWVEINFPSEIMSLLLSLFGYGVGEAIVSLRNRIEIATPAIE